jgi:hypothetical protein
MPILSKTAAHATQHAHKPCGWDNLRYVTVPAERAVAAVLTADDLAAWGPLSSRKRPTQN